MKPILKFLCFLIMFSSLSFAAIDVRRPTADSDPGSETPCSGTIIASSAMPYFYDSSGLLTYSLLPNGGNKRPIYNVMSRLFTDWEDQSGEYSSLTLYVYTYGTIEGIGGGQIMVQYSTNEGASWTTLRDTTSSYSGTYDTVSLSPTINLGNLQVRVCSVGNPESGVSLYGYDIKTVGQLQ